MKVVVVAYPDTQDLSALEVGAEVSVNDLSGGRVTAIAQLEEPDQALAPHTHDIAGTVTGASGPAIET